MDESRVTSTDSVARSASLSRFKGILRSWANAGNTSASAIRNPGTFRFIAPPPQAVYRKLDAAPGAASSPLFASQPVIFVSPILRERRVDAVHRPRLRSSRGAPPLRGPAATRAYARTTAAAAPSGFAWAHTRRARVRGRQNPRVARGVSWPALVLLQMACSYRLFSW